MARDRQRAKQRKARRAGQNPGPARSEPHRTNVPGELEHASGEADEFDAALVAGAGASGRDMAPPDDEVPADESADEIEDEELVEDALEADPAATGEIYADELEDLDEEDDAEVAPAGGGVVRAPSPRRGPPRRPEACSLALPPSFAPRGRSSSAYSGLIAARSRRPPPSCSASWWLPASTSASPIASPRKSSTSSSSRPPEGFHVSLVRRQHLLRSREQGQAEPRAPRAVAEPAPRRAAGRRPDRDRDRDEGQPEDVRGEAHDARLRPGEHGAKRRLVAARQGHARRHGLRRRVERAGPADPARGRPPAAPGGRHEGREADEGLDGR